MLLKAAIVEAREAAQAITTEPRLAEMLTQMSAGTWEPPANGISPTPAYIRVAIGLDYQGAAPVRGSRSGGSAEHMQVSVTVDQTRRQQQS